MEDKDKKLLLNTVKLALDVLTEEEYNNILNTCRDAVRRAVKE